MILLKGRVPYNYVSSLASFAGMFQNPTSTESNTTTIYYGMQQAVVKIAESSGASPYFQKIRLVSTSLFVVLGLGGFLFTTFKKMF